MATKYVPLLLFLTLAFQFRVGESLIAFTASLKTTVRFPKTQLVVKYDKVLTNYGNGYNKDTGIFTVPSSGLYVFTWTTAIKWGQWQETQLIHNEQMRLMTIADSYKRGDRSTATGTGVLNVSQNDTICVKTGLRGDRIIRGDGDSTFSGWQLTE